LTESSIEALNVGRVDATAALGLLDEPLDHGSTTLNDATVNLEALSCSLFDDLNDGDVRPGDQARTTRLSPSR
jgi:hypothetical protein